MRLFSERELHAQIDKWAKGIEGKLIDLDGYPLPPDNPYQCHDVWLSYITAIFGHPLSDGHAGGNGWTSEVWLQFPKHRPDLADTFTKHTGTKGVRKGDVLFWGYGDPEYPYSHVAVALGPISNGTVRTVTQNPGSVKLASLKVSKLLGYLRPKTESRTVIRKSYTPKPESRQKLQPGAYRQVGITDPKNSKGTRDVTIAKAGATSVYGQVNISGTHGEAVELAMAVDTTDKDGKNITSSYYLGAISGTITEGSLKLSMSSPVEIKANERVRLHVKPLGKRPVTVTFVRWNVAN